MFDEKNGYYTSVHAIGISIVAVILLLVIFVSKLNHIGEIAQKNTVNSDFYEFQSLKKRTMFSGEKFEHMMITPNVTGEKVKGLFEGKKNGLFPLRLNVNLNKNCKEFADEDKVTVFVQNDNEKVTFEAKRFSMGPKDITDGNINFEFSDED